MNGKADLLSILSSPVAYYAMFAKIGGGVTSGVFLSQLIYWTGRGKQADGWVWKSAEEMEDETGLTRNEQETARRNLKARGLIDERLAGVPATLHFRVNLDAIMAAVAQFGEKCQSGLAKSDKPDSGKAPNLLGENLQAIHRLSETTTTAGLSASEELGISETAQTPGEVPLLPQSEEERLLFRMLAQNTPTGKRPGAARFKNAQQANDYRSAVQVLNGTTKQVLEAFFRSGGSGLGHAVSYVCGAARKRQATPPLEAEYQPPMFFAPTSWEEA